MEHKELLQLRSYGLRAHQGWKRRSRDSDLLVQGKFNTLWPDLTIDESDPLVEHVYNEALNDKAATVAAVAPYVEVSPTRGTRKDEAEREAQKRRRAFISFLRDSQVEDKSMAWAFDWLQHGAMYGMPWKDWRTQDPHPFLIRFDPRNAFPLAHDTKDQLRSIFFLANRTLADLEADWGVSHDALRNLRGWLAGKTDMSKMPFPVELMWYADESKWGIALVAGQDAQGPFFRYRDPSQQDPSTFFTDWLVPLHDHKLDGCPAVEKARRTPDGEYRGALDDMIPPMKMAHTIMARLMEDIDFQIAAPYVVKGIENEEDWGPRARLRDDGSGTGDVKQVRTNINFEAMQQIQQLLNAARNVGAFPMQRSGDPGASISSAKGTVALQGGYNAQLGWHQKDFAIFYRRALERLANFDQVWCGGMSKMIQGWDEGELFTDKYDAESFWKDDFRCEIGFTRIGIDEQNHLTRLAIARGQQGLSRRSFMRKSGLVDNPLTEETEIALENATDAFMAFAYQQAAEGGNAEPLRAFVTKIDGDKVTVRSAALETIKEMQPPTPLGGMPQQGGAPGMDTMQMMASQNAEGIPGQAAGQPSAEGMAQLMGSMPKRLGRQMEAAR